MRSLETAILLIVFTSIAGNAYAIDDFDTYDAGISDSNYISIATPEPSNYVIDQNSPKLINTENTFTPEQLYNSPQASMSEIPNYYDFNNPVTVVNPALSSPYNDLNSVNNLATNTVAAPVDTDKIDWSPIQEQINDRKTWTADIGISGMTYKDSLPEFHEQLTDYNALQRNRILSDSSVLKLLREEGIASVAVDTPQGVIESPVIPLQFLPGNTRIDVYDGPYTNKAQQAIYSGPVAGFLPPYPSNIGVSETLETSNEPLKEENTYTMNPGESFIPNTSLPSTVGVVNGVPEINVAPPATETDMPFTGSLLITPGISTLKQIILGNSKEADLEIPQDSSDLPKNLADMPAKKKLEFIPTQYVSPDGSITQDMTFIKDNAQDANNIPRLQIGTWNDLNGASHKIEVYGSESGVSDKGVFALCTDALLEYKQYNGNDKPIVIRDIRRDSFKLDQDNQFSFSTTDGRSFLNGVEIPQAQTLNIPAENMVATPALLSLDSFSENNLISPLTPYTPSQIIYTGSSNVRRNAVLPREASGDIKNYRDILF